MVEQYILDDEKTKSLIEAALRQTYFAEYDQDFLETEEGREDIENNVFKRYNHSLRHVVPWLSRYMDLGGRRVLEIGCGTGSSTAALARFVGHITAYDIHAPSLEGAARRLDILQLDNVDLRLVETDNLTDHIVADSGSGYDVILLFAVLEHQTVEERHETLAACWQALGAEGMMVVVDTPNILCYFDAHTSRLPFLHMLPSRLYARYAVNSPREGFNSDFADGDGRTAGELELAIARWARGVSFHDFELALGREYREYIISHGFEAEILDWFPISVEEEILRWYVEHKGFDVPPAFTRWILNMIFRKSGHGRSGMPPEQVVPTTAFPARDRLDRLQRELDEKTFLLEELRRSKTWRLGNFMAQPYRLAAGLISLWRRRLKNDDHRPPFGQ